MGVVVAAVSRISGVGTSANPRNSHIHIKGPAALPYGQLSTDPECHILDICIILRSRVAVFTAVLAFYS